MVSEFLSDLSRLKDRPPRQVGAGLLAKQSCHDVNGAGGGIGASLAGRAAGGPNPHAIRRLAVMSPAVNAGGNSASPQGI